MPTLKTIMINAPDGKGQQSSNPGADVMVIKKVA